MLLAAALLCWSGAVSRLMAEGPVAADSVVDRIMAIEIGRAHV